MSRRDDDFFDTNSIVPDTDDRAGHIPQPRNPAPKPRVQAISFDSNRLGSKIIIIGLFTVLFAVSGFFHYQITQQQMLNTQLQTRIETLEAQLGVTSSNASQASETLGDKIKSLDTRLTSSNNEIAKLWAITNDKNKKMLDEHEKSLATLQSAVGELKKSTTQNEKLAAETAKIASDGKQVADNAAHTATELGSSVNTLQQKLSLQDSQVREASQQSTITQGQTEQLQTKLDAIAKKVSDQEESLRSIDSFRRSVNSDLSKLKQDHMQASGATPIQ